MKIFSRPPEWQFGRTRTPDRWVQRTNSTAHFWEAGSRRRTAVWPANLGYCSHNRKAAARVMRVEESSIPLQSGNWSSSALLVAASLPDFLVELFGAMLQEYLVNQLRIWPKPIFLNQLYHIIRVLHNPSRMTMLDGMAFQRQQMHQRNHSHPRHIRWGRHRFHRHFRKRIFADEHQIQWKRLRFGSIKLQEGWSFPVKHIPQFSC